MKTTRGRTIILTSEMMRRALIRISHEIIEETGGTKDIVILGIRTKGVHLARRIAEYIKTFEGTEIPFGILDITLYRDDLHNTTVQPVIGKTELPFDVTGKVVVLVDDVLYTGRTIRAGLDEIIDFGRPSRILLAALIDRGHRELPIRADFVGKNIPTSRDDDVIVKVAEVEGVDEVEVVPCTEQDGEDEA
ncbi:MAG: bifunctional pyr operon transcriptional regulator/uracil phosphoribosyltransferase PyrR [Candidatus Glassbacteria bacterium]